MNYLREIRKRIKETRLPAQRVDGFHPSILGSDYYCARKYIIAYLCKKHNVDIVQKPLSPETVLTFDIGHSVHDAVRNRILGPIGVLKGKWVNNSTNEVVDGFMPVTECDSPWNEWSYEETRFESNKHNLIGESEFCITGAIDGIVEFEGTEYLLDIKTINQYWWNRLEEVSKTYLVQMTFYMYLTGYRKGLFLYVNKNSSEMTFYEVSYDEALLNDFIDMTIIEPQHLLMEGKLPFKHKSCYKDTTTMAKGCDYQSICFACDDSTESVETFLK